MVLLDDPGADVPGLKAEIERLRAQIERSARGGAFLGEATRVLYDSLDYEKTLATVARLALPVFADYALVDLLGPEGEIRRVEIAHRDAAMEALARAVLRADRIAAQDPVRAVLAKGEPILVARITAEEIAAATPDPEERALALRLGPRSTICVPLRARGRTLGTLSFAATDESGRTFDDHDLRLARELGVRAGMAIDNARLYRDAREAVRVRDDFLAVAGHELKSPLTALKVQIQGLERLVDKGTLAERADELPARLARASAHVERLSNLVADLLDVSRITAGRLELAPQDGVDLAAIIRDVAQRFQEDLDEMGSELSLDVPPHLFGRWDAPRLDHMIANLLANAIKYGAGKPIRIRAATDGRRARLEVHDEGIGIEYEEQLRIFGRFERAVSARRYGGFGLGLWIVHRIVEMCGGTIVLESDPGHGAAFLIELPTGA